MLALSLVCHLVAFSLIIWSQSLPAFRPEPEPVTYVDVVTLPVASPQAGTPAPVEAQAPKSAAPAAPAHPPAAAMVLPAAKPAKGAKAKPKAEAKLAPQKKPVKPAPVEDARDFDERMAKLERQAEEKRQADVLNRISNRARGKVGMPGAKGTEAGSDYASYIQSRLKDAFREVVASQSRAPQVMVRLTIGPDGRVARYRVEKSSGDPLFDAAVSRAVTLASRSFKPPPGGGSFERVFRFKPEGVAFQ